MQNIKFHVSELINKADLGKAYLRLRKDTSASFKVFLGISLLLPSIFAFPVAASTGTVATYPIPDLLGSGDPAPAPPVSMLKGPDGNLWFARGNEIGVMTASGTVTAEYSLGTALFMGNFVNGPDGNLWFLTNSNGIYAVDNVTTSGVITTVVTLPSGTAYVNAFALGSDGNFQLVIEDNTNNQTWDSMTPDGTITTVTSLSAVSQFSSYDFSFINGDLWFIKERVTLRPLRMTFTINSMTPDGAVTTYSLPTGTTDANNLMNGPDGNLWFAYTNASDTALYSMTTDGTGTMTGYALPSGTEMNSSIINGPGGGLWFGAYAQGSSDASIDSMTTGGTLTAQYTYPVDATNVTAINVATGPDDNLWFSLDGEQIEDLTSTTGSALVQAINTGGSASDDYSADTDFSGGTTYISSASVDTSNVASPAPQDVYQSSRYGNSFSYALPNLTPSANYTLMLQFNEPYWGVGNTGGGVGSRVFNVAVNGTTVLTNYDIYKTAGGANRAITEEIPVTADTNGTVTVQFTSVTDNAIVSGLQLFTGTLPPQPPHQTYTFSSLINAGGDAVGNFAADSDFSGGTTYTSSAVVDTSNVTNPAPESVFASSRYGNNFSYTVPGLSPNTAYNVQLDFDEPYWGVGNNGGVGSRVFNVAINDTPELSNFDIFAATGGANIAIAKDFTVTSDANGKIMVQFTSVTDNAIVSGVEVTQP